MLLLLNSAWGLRRHVAAATRYLLAVKPFARNRKSYVYYGASFSTFSRVICPRADDDDDDDDDDDYEEEERREQEKESLL